VKIRDYAVSSWSYTRVSGVMDLHPGAATSSSGTKTAKRIDGVDRG
jgi:hypothetical protein